MAEIRHHKLGLMDSDCLDMYYYMYLTRKLDERMWVLNRAGKIPFAVSCQGQEAAQVAAAFALDRFKDYVLPYYRDLGFVLSWGMTPKEILLGVFAKREDPNGGARQMPGHFGCKRLRIVTASSPVTTQVPHAVGIALAAQMEGEDIVTFVSFGEGSSNQGDFHEGLNFAGVHQLPVIFFCENNGYAISVPVKKQLACASVADRAVGYGMPGRSVDGNDLLSVYATMKEAVERARSGGGPSLIEAVVYRLTPHTSDDDDTLYRDPKEVEEARKKDPLPSFRQYLLEAGIQLSEIEEREERARLEVDEATIYAENAPDVQPEDALKYVYAP